MGTNLETKEELVISIIQSVVFKLYKDRVSLDSELREDLGIDSIKLIAIAALLAEEGYDVISYMTSSGNVYAGVERVRDIVDILNEM